MLTTSDPIRRAPYTIWRCPDCGCQPGNRKQPQRCRDSGHASPERVEVVPKPAANTTITVRHIQRGQPRNYAPHTYESEIIVEGKNRWDGVHEDDMKALVQVLVHPFTEDPVIPNSMSSYYRPRLVRLEQVSEEQLGDDSLGPRREVWIARVEEPYCD